MSKERAAKVMQEIFSKGTYEGDLLGIKITDVNAALDPQFERVSDTPKTDVAQHTIGSVFSRHLERELAEAREELNDKRKFCYAVEQALDGLKGDYVETIKELRKDAGRLNWLEKLEDNFCNIDRITSAHGKFNGKKQSLRDAIDAAMKEGGE